VYVVIGLIVFAAGVGCFAFVREPRAFGRRMAST